MHGTMNVKINTFVTLFYYFSTTNQNEQKLFSLL